MNSINGFQRAGDRITFGVDLFDPGDPTPGALPAGWFVANGTGRAEEADDRVIYNQENGALWFDADGVGGAAGVFIARLTAAPHINAANVLID